MRKLFKLDLFQLGIILGLLANFRFTALRIIAILFWIAIPIILLFRKQRIDNNNYLQFTLLTFFTVLLTFPFLLNSNSLSLNLTGPAVELFTPFLAPFGILYMGQKKTNFDSHKVIKLIVVLLVLEAAYRFIVAPDLFLNYFNRQQAKTIGWFSTTNVNGQILASLFFVIWQEKDFKNRKLFLITVILLLITAMARAATVSVMITFLMIYLFNNRVNFWLLILGFLVITFFVIDPLNLGQDGSFLSKIEFITTTIEIIKSSSFTQIIFGYGLNFDSITSILGVNGWSPHIPFLKAYMYFGLIGLMFYVFHISQLVFLGSRNFLAPLLTYLILGMAGAPIFWPGLISLNILTRLEKQNSDNEKI